MAASIQWLSAQMDAVQRHLAAMEARNQEAWDRMHERVASHERIGSSIVERIQARLDKLEDPLNDPSHKVATLDAKLEDFEARLGELEASLSARFDRFAAEMWQRLPSVERELRRDNQLKALESRCSRFERVEADLQERLVAAERELQRGALFEENMAHLSLVQRQLERDLAQSSSWTRTALQSLDACMKELPATSLIVRPSLDYDEKLAQRDYSVLEKQRRALDRVQKADAMRLRRAQHFQGHLGCAQSTGQHLRGERIAVCDVGAADELHHCQASCSTTR